jgi:hypothetical protein
MDNTAETKLAITLCTGEIKRFTWEMYVWIHMEHHTVLNGLREYGYSGIDGSSKVQILMRGIKTELDVCKANIMASPSLHCNCTGMVEFYLTFIKHMKAENPQMNVSEVSYIKNMQSGNNSSNKRGSSGISNAEVADRFYEKHEFNTLTPENNNAICLQIVKHGHFGKA